MANFGLLVPTGGGEDVPLKKNRILIGRRDNCDIVLRFPNVSGQHCRLSLESGYWFVKDLDSRNGVKVNGHRVTGQKRLDPGNVLSIAKHQYEIQYDPESLGASGPPPMDEDNFETLMGKSLLDKAGLERRSEADRSSNKHKLDEE